MDISLYSTTYILFLHTLSLSQNEKTMEKWHWNFIGDQFAWLTQCSGLENVVELSDIAGACKSSNEMRIQDNTHDDLDHYVVVTTYYPSSYGCNKGKSWTRAEIAANSDMTVTPYSYEDKADAIADAHDIRMESGYFDEWQEDIGEPPFDSAKMKDYDNDDEVLIQVMTKREYSRLYLQLKADNEAYLAKKREKANFEMKLKDEMFALQIQDASPRVHYSTFPRAFDIPADLEIKEEGGTFVIKDTRKAKARGIRSVFIKGKELFHPRKDDRIPIQILMTACAEYSGIEEIHIHMESDSQRDDVPARFFQVLLKAAPRIGWTLKVLSIQGGKISPDTLISIGNHCTSLEHLDVADTFACGLHGCDDDSIDKPDDHAFNSAILHCLDNLESLRRLDLGFSGKEDVFFSFCMSQSLHDFMVHEKGLEVTMSRQRNPQAWSSHEAQLAAKHVVLSKFASIKDNPALRSLAVNALQGFCPACGKRGNYQCSKCHKVWFCSVDCQKEYWPDHKEYCIAVNTHGSKIKE